MTGLGSPDDLGRPIDQAGKYRLGALLGVGGMAEVFRGYVAGVEGFSRPVAIKRVLASYSADERFSAMFIQEARLASLLAHPCVVSVLDFDRDPEGRLFQVLEFIDGIDLEKLAPPGESATLPAEIIVYLIGEILEGLNHAHTRTGPAGKPLGIVHRDCTPSNVLLTWDGTVRLSDFGIAKAMQATQVTASGTVKGKPMYMAPEQAIGASSMDARVDLFAVGVMLYELLTGQRPFTGDAATAVMFQIHLYGQGQHRVPTPNEASGGRAPVALSNLAMRLMAPQAGDRPATAKDALAELRQCGRAATRDELAWELATRYPERAPRPAASLVTPVPQASLPTNVERARAGGFVAAVQTLNLTPSPVGDLPSLSPLRSRRPLLIALGAGVVVLAGSIALALSGGGATPTPDGSLETGSAGAASMDARPAGDAAEPDPVPTAAAAPVGAAPLVDAGAAPMVDAASAPIDAPQSVDAGRTRRTNTKERPGSGSGSGHRFIETTIGGGK